MPNTATFVGEEHPEILGGIRKDNPVAEQKGF